MLNNSNQKTRWANLLENRFAHLSRKEAILIWIAFFLLYAATTGLDILPADSGEFQLITAKWGIAHPPGYPLYTMVGAIWSHLIFWGSFPYRTNLLSAVLAATSLMLTFQSIVLWSLKGGLNKRSARVGGLAAVLLLGSSGTFWAQATIANIRMPTLLFTVWGFYILAYYDYKSTIATRDRILHQLAFISGLGIGHHPSLIFVASGWVTYILLCDVKILWTPRRWYKVIVIAVCAWGIPQLYLPIRDAMPNVLLSPGNLSTWQGFWGHVLARGFSGDMFAFATKADLILRLPLLPSLFRFQFPVYSMCIMTIGWIWLLRWQRKLAIAVFISWIIHTFVTITYRAPQTIEYLMPAYCPMVLVFGISIAGCWSYGSSQSKRFGHITSTISVGCILILLLSWVLTIPDFSRLAVNGEVRARTEPLLTAATDNALILADWRWVTPLWMIQNVENIAKNVSVKYVYPEEPKAYDQVWLDRVRQAGDIPVFVTHKYDWPEYNFDPVGGGYRLYRRPLLNLPDGLEYKEYIADLGSIRLLGYRIEGDIRPGQIIEFHLVWQAIADLNPPPSFTARLWDAKGRLLTASDRYLGRDTTIGEIRFTQFTLQLPLDVCPEHILATVGLYTADNGDFTDIGTETLSTLTMMCKYPALPVVRTWPGYIVNNGPFIRGIDYDMRTNSTGTTYLHLVGPGASFMIQSSSSLVTVPRLGIGQFLTILIPFDHTDTTLHLARVDGSPIKVFGVPFPSPTQEERYTPFSDKLVLISSDLHMLGNQTVLDLEWLTAQPMSDDYVVSARLRPGDNSWELRHDMQPGLGAIPTLKWVTLGSRFLDPHPFDVPPTNPSNFDITVYEPFRMTPLLSPYGEIVSYSLP